MKQCCDCKQIKDLSLFSKASRRSDGYQTACKTCAAARRKERYEAKKDEERAQNREWHVKNRPWLSDERRAYMRQWKSDNADRVSVWTNNRRAAVRSLGTIDPNAWVELCREYGNKCLKCGCINQLSMDHVVPISKGGTNTIDNVQPLCLPCNMKKGGRTEDYRPQKVKNND